MTPTRFDRDTAVQDAGEGRLSARVDDGWWVQAGPNGGYLTAILLRAAATAAPADRVPRSLHARFLAPPRPGDVELTTTRVREGRSMSTIGVRMQQAGRVVASAGVTFSGAFSSLEFCDRTLPPALPLDRCEALPKQIPLNERYDLWRGIGPAFRTGERAESGGWLRFAEPRMPDVYTLAAAWDAWPPASFARAMERRFRGAVPTVEVSLYFRSSLPRPGMQADDHLLIHVRSTMAAEGLVEEDTELWSADGTLLLQARELALLIER
jgi:acyl-CoA thioesterase